MSFWNQNQKSLLQRWELYRRQIEREVAERRRDLVRRNMRQSDEWNSYEPYTDWYLEREVEAFVAAVDEISSTGHDEIDDDSVNEMDRMLVEMIDRRRQLAPPEALRAFGSQEARIKGSARVSLLRIQSQRRAERERGVSPPPRAPVRRKVADDVPPPSPARADAGPAGVATLTAAPATGPSPSRGSFSSPAAAVADRPPVDAHRLAESLRRLGQLIQRLPDPEEQAESLEELQFIAEEATVEPDARKLRMIDAALQRIAARIHASDADLGSPAAGLAEPIRRWFAVG
jgi:hypothetical protein